MRLRELVRLLPLGALVTAGCPASGQAERDRAPPLDDGADAPASSTAPAGSHTTCGATACAGGSCGGG